MKALTLLQEFETKHVEHMRFKEVLDQVEERIRAALDGNEPKFQAIAGPSRVGKSAVIAALKARHPGHLHNRKRRLPVVFVDSIDAPSPALLPLSVLRALKVPIPPSKRTVAALTDFMHEELDLAENRALVFDEASQLVEAGSRVEPDEAARWFKNVVMKGRSVVAAGLPYIQELLQADPQLEGRAYRTIRFEPYRPDIAEERSAYASVVLAFLQLLKQHGWTIDVDQGALLSNMYLHAPGLSGGIRGLMRELVRRLEGKQPGAITWTEFATVAAALQPLGPGEPAPFENEGVMPHDLSNAYLHVMERNNRTKKRKKN